MQRRVFRLAEITKHTECFELTTDDIDD